MRVHNKISNTPISDMATNCANTTIYCGVKYITKITQPTLVGGLTASKKRMTSLL